MEAKRNWAYVSSPTKVVVGIATRAEFQRIALPEMDHRAEQPAQALLSKTLDAGGITVVFQFWINE